MAYLILTVASVVVAYWMPATATATADAMTNVTFHIARINNGDVFSQTGLQKRCTEETCVGLSSGTATYATAQDLCTCKCHSHLPTFREDLHICVDDVHECTLAPFVSGSTSQHIPFVVLPLKGQIVHPGREISFTGIRIPVCAITGAKFMTEDGWTELRNPLDNDVPFRLFRDEGRTFLQWYGNSDLRSKLCGRLVVVHLMCREVSNLEQKLPIFTPCIAFRIDGTPYKYTSNVSEVIFIPDAHASVSSTTSSQLSATEYVAIGICSVLLGLVYVASVFLYLHLRRKGKAESCKKACIGGDGMRANEEGIIKNNPLLTMSPHFIPNESMYSDTNSSDNEAAPDIIRHHEEKMKHQTTSAMVHQQKPRNFSIHHAHFSVQESLHSDSTTEKLPEENVSIVETMETAREERPENIRSLSGSTRRKLYFNPAYFEPQLLLTPPPAAVEFLTKIREVIAIAKEKMAAKRFTPSLLNIPEEDGQLTISEPIPIETRRPESSRPKRSPTGVNINLKRENSRRKTCSGCPGCKPQELRGCGGQTSNGGGKLPEFAALPACRNCVVPSDSKQTIIRKWLEDIPDLKQAGAARSSAVDVRSSPRRVRSPARSLPPPDQSETASRAVSPRPASDRLAGRTNGSPKLRRKKRKPFSPPPPPPVNKEAERKKEAVKEKTTMNLPPPDMIQEAMQVDRTEKRVALTQKQQEEIIKGLTHHQKLVLQGSEAVGGGAEKTRSGNATEYETDSLERTVRKGYSTPTEYASVSSSHPSPSLSAAALPDQEEMTMRNAIFNKRTGHMTISKINMETPPQDGASLQEDAHDYQLIVTRKGTFGSNVLEAAQKRDEYSLVSEVYVNNGYNYGSAPSSPGSSNSSSLERKAVKVKYDEVVTKPGKLLIEVEDCADHYIPVHESDGFEPDTLDRKPSKQRSSKTDFADSLERPNQILLRTTGSFRSDALSTSKSHEEEEDGEFKRRVFGSLRDIYEAKTKGRAMTQLSEDAEDEKGRILTLEERHSKRQRQAKGLVQPDVIPPPPHDAGGGYEGRTLSKVKTVPGGCHMPPATMSAFPKNAHGRSAVPGRCADAAVRSVPVGAPAPPRLDGDYELRLQPQKPHHHKRRSDLVKTADVILTRQMDDRYVLHLCQVSMALNNALSKKSRASMKEDSGYLSGDSCDIRMRSRGDLRSYSGGSESEESLLGDGHSESGAESVETHSVFFDRINEGRFQSKSEDSIHCDDSDSEPVSYATVVPVLR